MFLQHHHLSEEQRMKYIFLDIDGALFDHKKY